MAEPKSLGLSVAVIADGAEAQQQLEHMLAELMCEPKISVLIEDMDWPQWQDEVSVDVWLIWADLENTSSDGFEDWLAEVTEAVILEDEKISKPDTQAYKEWQQRWHKKLRGLAQGRAELVSWPSQLWFIAASTGGPEGVGEFLQNLSPGLDVGFVYLQHTSVAAEASILRAVDRRSNYPVQMGKAGHAIAPGRVTMISAKESMLLNKQGQLRADGRAWASEFAPNADQFIHSAMHKLAAMRHCQLGVIVFSGMGDDGAAACRYAHQLGAKVWVQSPDASISPYMPLAAQATNCVEYSGSPKEMAQRLEAQLVSEQTLAANSCEQGLTASLAP